MTTQGWPAVLDELEAHVLAAESLIETGQFAELEPWQPPEVTEPLPAELVERARELAERQEALIAALPGAMEHVAKMRDLANRILETTTTNRPSIYIDVKA